MSDWRALRDSLGLTLRPIDTWPGKRHSPERSPFSAPLKDTLDILKRELRELHAREIVLQVAIPERSLRLDGLPRAGAIAEHPGVILAFESRHGPLRLYLDRFTRWEHNLRALAMHLADLRHAGLYGVGEDGQQYTGWKALPEPVSAGDEVGQAATLLAGMVKAQGIYVAGPDLLRPGPWFEMVRRTTLRVTHPDAGGDAASFRQVQAAIEILARHHGRKAA